MHDIKILMSYSGLFSQQNCQVVHHIPSELPGTVNTFNRSFENKTLLDFLFVWILEFFLRRRCILYNETNQPKNDI